MRCDLCSRDFDGRKHRFVERRYRNFDRRTRQFFAQDVSFRVTPHRFYSKKCLRFWQLGSQPKLCRNCVYRVPGKFYRKHDTWKRRPYFCSTGCRVIFRLRKMRVNPKEFQRMRNGSDWQWISRKVKEIDCYTCQVCKKKLVEAKLYADHIVPFRLSQSHDWENLLTLCRACHSLKAHLENRLFNGYISDFLNRLRKAGWPMSRVRSAMSHYGLPLSSPRRPLPLFWIAARWMLV